MNSHRFLNKVLLSSSIVACLVSLAGHAFARDVRPGKVRVDSRGNVSGEFMSLWAGKDLDGHDIVPQRMSGNPSSTISGDRCLGNGQVSGKLREAYSCAMRCLNRSDCKAYTYYYRNSRGGRINGTCYLKRGYRKDRLGKPAPRTKRDRYTGVRTALTAQMKSCVARRERDKRLASMPPTWLSVRNQMTFNATPYQQGRTSTPVQCMMSCYGDRRCQRFRFHARRNPLTPRAVLYSCGLFDRALAPAPSTNLFQAGGIRVVPPGSPANLIRPVRIAEFPGRRVGAGVSLSTSRTFGPAGCAAQCVRSKDCRGYDFRPNRSTDPQGAGMCRHFRSASRFVDAPGGYQSGRLDPLRESPMGRVGG
ncbi:MAG: PAN domain-containing protein [Myxococcota bacterium]